MAEPYRRLRTCQLTVPAPGGVPLGEAATLLYETLAARWLEDDVEPLQEKIYGPLAGKAEVLDVRRAVLEGAGFDPRLPCTYVAGRRHEDLGLGGAQVWGIRCAGDSAMRVQTVETSVGVTGRLLEGAGIRMLHLSSFRGAGADGELPGAVSDQAEQMFVNAETALSEHRFAFRHVARTWIHLARILDWYGEFNRVRTAFLKARGITGSSGGRSFPASTGIQGTSGDEECLMDLLAVDGDERVVAMRPIHRTSRQEQPLEYGSSFSRGMTLRLGDEESVFVSGTASIDACGQTLHCWQREAQIVETLLSVAALLEDQGASLRDVTIATLFCKDRGTLETYRRVTRQLGIGRMPVIPVLADVCRPELMVEIEALATVPRRARSVRTGLSDLVHEVPDESVP